MSPVKIVTLLTYVVLAVLALTQGESAVGVWSLRVLLILAAVHLVEVVAFFKVCQSAGGSLPMHLLNVLLFGIFHVKEIKAVQAGN